MSQQPFLLLGNPGAASLERLPLLPFEEFRELLLHAVRDRGMRVSAFFAWEARGGRRLVAALSDDTAGRVCLTSAPAPERYACLTREAAAFHWFERELHEETGIVPEGHPWLKPIRFCTGRDGEEPAVTDYFRLHGHAAHEVAVGPVHAGVIEPGHFRFQCLGEDVHTLEISLGYQHRGVERMLVGGPSKRTPFVMETIAGDSSAAYAGAYCGLLEALDEDAGVSPRDAQIRLLAWELERIANHIGDLGALAGDVAFLQTAAFCGRIRGDFLNLTAAICGNRFGRGLVTPGGVGWKVDEMLADRLLRALDTNAADLSHALELMFEAPSVLDRLENTGTVTDGQARDIGLVGVAARACGLRRDVRVTHPYGPYGALSLSPATVRTGDVFARATVRRLELTASLELARGALRQLAGDELSKAAGRAPRVCRPSTIAVSLAEAWRGEVCQVAITDGQGRFERLKVVDPSFHNWFGLALALRNGQISDFPICNKSFNLSYCGHDL